MSDGVTIDPQQLHNFAAGVRDLITNLNTVKAKCDSLVTPGAVKFGQNAQYPGGLDMILPPADMLSGQLSQHCADFDDNVKSLVTALTELAAAADAIAANYKTAADIDQLSASSVNAMLNPALPPAGLGGQP